MSHALVVVGLVVGAVGFALTVYGQRHRHG